MEPTILIKMLIKKTLHVKSSGPLCLLKKPTSRLCLLKSLYEEVPLRKCVTIATITQLFKTDVDMRRRCHTNKIVIQNLLQLSNLQGKQRNQLSKMQRKRRKIAKRAADEEVKKTFAEGDKEGVKEAKKAKKNCRTGYKEGEEVF